MAMPGGPLGNNNAGMNDQEQQTIKMMQAVMESCPAKVAMAGTAGFVMGGAFGLFMSSFEYAGPTMTEEMVQQSKNNNSRQHSKIWVHDPFPWPKILLLWVLFILEQNVLLNRIGPKTIL
ncbi:unnamed protein product [Absidia cylindrospora]